MPRRDVFAYFFLLVALVFLSVSGLRAQNWTPAAGIPAAPVLGVTAHEGGFYAYTLDSVYVSVDSGSSWLPVLAQPGEPGQLVSLHSHGGYLYLGTTNAGIYRTSDAGLHWETFNNGYPGGGVVQFLTLGDSLYAGTDGTGVCVRNPAQQSAWVPFNDGLTRFGVEAMATSGDLMLATIGMSTYARMRGAPAWTEILLDSAGGQLSVNEFLRFQDHLFAGVGTGIFRGTPDAQSWNKVGISLLPFRPVTELAIHGNKLFAGVPYALEHFICTTDDAGDTWEVKAHEFAELLGMEVIGNRLFAARADGLWYLDLGAPTSVVSPGGNRVESFRLEQNYPNPFNPTTVFTSQLPGASQVRIIVYDVLGREVATLVNERRAAGSYRDVFNGTGLASGVYVYRMTAGSFVQSRTMLLVR